MPNFYFISTDKLDFGSFDDIKSFVEAYPDFQMLHLNDENELEILLNLLGVNHLKSKETRTLIFTKYWNISNFLFPEYDDMAFDKFYHKWIEKSRRNNNMDEYGSLVFLKAKSSKWNKLKHKLILMEKSN